MAFPSLLAIKAFVTSKRFLIPAAIVALLLAVAGGTYAYLNHQTDELVATKVEQADANATIRSYETKEIITRRVEHIDLHFDNLQTRTTQDYADVRTSIQLAPEEERTAPAPRLIIDTLNELDRLRSERDSGGVPDPDVPVG